MHRKRLPLGSPALTENIVSSPVWPYIRVSGDEQADRGLPGAGQRRAISEYAREHSLDVGRGDEGSG